MASKSADAKEPEKIGGGAAGVESEGAPGNTEAGFPVVGIGASAGGLAAFEAFFLGMPRDREVGMAFVLVQHLAPDHKSLLAELVKRYTRMRVFEVEDGMRVEPNTAYVIPPNRDMALHEGVLRLSEPASPHGQRLPIDFFFRSLAHDQRDRGICVVLSGTGTDGTMGVRAVKGEGGMAMAQNPESTEYDGMPRSAIATGLVDYVLPAAEMPAQLCAYATRAAGSRRPSSAPVASGDAAALKQLFALLRAQTGHDFSQYKQNTISRRVERRMAVRQIERLDDYVLYLRETPAEADALFRDFLIGVTNFFRDPEAFAAFEAQVIPRLLAEKPAGGTVRVWVPGCSTGEEAYSIAIALREKLGEHQLGFKVQIFATDIDSKAIETARSGVYPASIAADITPARLAQHFSPLEGAYRVHKGIRDLLILSEQDVVKDPPFSKLDLISCRNVMIYMGSELQKKLIALFHYALNPSGALFLGTSETVGESGHFFSTIDRKAKLYRRNDDANGGSHPSFADVSGVGVARERVPPRKAPDDGKSSLRALTERALLDDARVGALVNERGELLYLHGHTGQYLQPAPGEIGVNILKMAREGLRQDLTSALHQAVEGKEPMFRPGLRVKTNGDFTLVDLTVRPVPAGAEMAGALDLFLVIFEPSTLGPEEKEIPVLTAGGENASRRADDPSVVALRRELRTKDEYLRVTQDQMQSSNEELKSSNEELQSTNEELQSTNEELETSKEELQSVNEELATVNAELQSKVADLSRVNNDMNNLLAGTGIGTLFVDRQLRIRRFTPALTEFINVIQTDIGRPVGHIVSNLVGYDRLVADVQSVLETLAPVEVEVQTHAGLRYRLRILPYRTSDNVVDGAVITFTEVTAIKAQPAAPPAAGLRNGPGGV